MTAVLADARPKGLDVSFRPGNPLTVELTWPAGELTGRTFESSLGGTALDLAVAGDVMTIEATAVQTVIVLAPATWLLTETTGGASNDLLIGTWSPSARAGDGASSVEMAIPVTTGAVEVDVTVVSGQSSIVALAARLDTAEAEIDAHLAEPSGGGAHGLIIHRWAVDGWDPFSERFVVTADGDQSHTLSVSGRRGRVTASAETDGNFREWFLHEDTSWADGEISGILYPPSNWDASPINRPQHGFVCRAQEVPGSPGTWRAFVVWLDMAFATSGMLANTWQADGVTLTQGTQDPGDFTGPSLTLVQRQMRVLRAARIDAFDVAQYWVTPIHTYGMVNGNLVTVAGMVDTSFNRTSVAVSNVASGFFQVADTTANSNVDSAAGVGTVDFVGVNRTLYPRAMAACLVGDELHAKHWRPEEPEPDWGDATRVATLAPPSAPDLPDGDGLWGVVAGHCHDSAWLEYGDLTFRRR